MKRISESIIGRRGSYKSSSKTPGQIYLAQDLEYGDVIISDTTGMHYIFLPSSQCNMWWSENLTVEHILVRYIFHAMSHAIYADLDRIDRNYEFVRHVREYRNIKTSKDLKTIFDKYNIPYE